MEAKEIQFLGLSLAMYLILKLLPRVMDYPILVILASMWWPHVSGNIQTLLMVWGVFEALQLGLVMMYWVGGITAMKSGAPPFFIFPAFIIQAQILYYMWFRVARYFFKKVGLDRRVSAITSDLSII